MKSELVAAAIGGAVVGAGVVLLLHAGGPAVLWQEDAGPSQERHALPEARREPVLAPAPLPASRTLSPSTDGSTPTEASARLLELDQEVRRLRQELAATRAVWSEDTADGIVRALALVESAGDRIAQARARIPLRTRFVELAPGDPRAVEQLAALVSDHVMAEQPAGALEAVRRLGALLSVEAWQLYALRLSSLQLVGDWPSLAQACEQILQSPAPDHVRASASFHLDHAKAGQRREAGDRR